MIKRLSNQQPMQVLRLWPSRYSFRDSTKPLWIGTVQYRIIWTHYWLTTHHDQLLTLADPISLLQTELKPGHWQSRAYPATVQLHQFLNNNQFVHLLLIDS